MLLDGGIARRTTALKRGKVEATPVRCPDAAKAAEMIALIEAVRKEQDSIGGVCELVATGVPPGLGEPVFDKLKADLAKGLIRTQSKSTPG